jgi:hypothetical protein
MRSTICGGGGELSGPIQSGRALRKRARREAPFMPGRSGHGTLHRLSALGRRPETPAGRHHQPSRNVVAHRTPRRVRLPLRRQTSSPWTLAFVTGHRTRCAVLRARQTPLRSAFWRVVRRPLQGSDSNADCRYAVAVSCEQSVSVGRPRPGRERRALTRIVSPPLLQAERRCTGLRLCCFCGGNRFSGTDERSPRSIGACPLARTASTGRHGSASKTACPVRRCYPCTPGSMASRRGAGRTQG